MNPHQSQLNFPEPSTEVTKYLRLNRSIYLSKSLECFSEMTLPTITANFPSEQYFLLSRLVAAENAPCLEGSSKLLFCEIFLLFDSINSITRDTPTVHLVASESRSIPLNSIFALKLYKLNCARTQLTCLPKAKQNTRLLSPHRHMALEVRKHFPLPTCCCCWHEHILARSRRREATDGARAPHFRSACRCEFVESVSSLESLFVGCGRRSFYCRSAVNRFSKRNTWMMWCNVIFAANVFSFVGLWIYNCFALKFLLSNWSVYWPKRSDFFFRFSFRALVPFY